MSEITISDMEVIEKGQNAAIVRCSIGPMA